MEEKLKGAKRKHIFDKFRIIDKVRKGEKQWTKSGT